MRGEVPMNRNRVVAGVFAHDPLDAAATALVQVMEEQNPALRWARARAVIELVTQEVYKELLESMDAQVKVNLKELLAPILDRKEG